MNSQLQVPSFVNDRNKQWREQIRIEESERKRINDKNRQKVIPIQEHYKAKSGSKTKAQESIKSKVGVIAAIALTATIAIGGLAKYNEYQQIKNSPTNYTNQIPSNIKNGMNNFLVNEIEEKENRLNRYKTGEISLEQLTSGDMETFVKEYAELAKKVAGNKLADKEGLEGVEFKYIFEKEDGPQLFAYDLEGNRIKIPKRIGDTYQSAVDLQEIYIEYKNGEVTGKQVVDKVKGTFKNTGELATTVYVEKDKEER